MHIDCRVHLVLNIVDAVLTVTGASISFSGRVVLSLILPSQHALRRSSMTRPSSMPCQYFKPGIPYLIYLHALCTSRFTPLILSYFFLSIREARRADIEGPACADDESGVRSAVVFAQLSERETTICEGRDRECGELWDMESEGTVI